MTFDLDPPRRGWPYTYRCDRCGTSWGRDWQAASRCCPRGRAILLVALVFFLTLAIVAGLAIVLSGGRP